MAPGADACIACSIGMYSDSSAAAECTECPPGTYNSNEGSSSVDDCIQCPAGTFSNFTIQGGDSGSLIILDEPEFISTDSKCEPCPAGQDSAIGSSECSPTSLGFFNDGSGTRPCAPGSFSNETGAIACTLCPRGSYAREPGTKTSGCFPCPLGSYADAQGNIVCQSCPEGRTTFRIGASAIEQCDEIPTPVQYLDAKYENFACAELLEIDLVVTVENATRREEILNRRLNQVGNGLCNNVPWNTKQCDWDGGDCCPLTCVVPSGDDVAEDQFISELSCTQTTFACLDPNAQGVPLGQCSVQLADRPLSQLQFNESVVSVDDEFLERIGDGVCDPALNTEGNDFDGGDCCPFTCTINAQYPDSCLGSYEFCSDEQDNEPDTEAPDISFGAFKLPNDVTTTCASIPEAPLAFATDNDPCFDGVVELSEAKIKKEDNTYDLLRTWSATDAAGNTRQVVAVVSVTDADQCENEAETKCGLFGLGIFCPIVWIWGFITAIVDFVFGFF